MPDKNNELVFQRATEIRHLLISGEVSAQDVVHACIDRIEEVNPQVNAIVTKTYELAHDQAMKLDQGGNIHAPLAGLPIAHKDLLATKGIRTTYGSTLMQDHVPKTDDLLVTRMRSAGAITIGKTNTPEYGAGSHTFNRVFGSTCNPYNFDKSCGGSSGGAAVALATRMVPLADGGDFGGSLRNPAAFCNVIGFRPSPGRVPGSAYGNFWSDLATLGPMARSIDDVALFFSVLAGPTYAGLGVLETPGSKFSPICEYPLSDCRIAFTRDFGGLAVEKGVRDTVEQFVKEIEKNSGTVAEASPDFSEAGKVFHILRAFEFRKRHGQWTETQRKELKDTIIWNYDEGMKLTLEDYEWALLKRQELVLRVQEFFKKYDLLIGPTTQVLPFDLTSDWVHEINGEPQESYIDWMQSCSWITLAGTPALSLPGGFSDGLPVGVQLIAGHRQDLRLLRMAKTMESFTNHARVSPNIP